MYDVWVLLRDVDAFQGEPEGANSRRKRFCQEPRWMIDPLCSRPVRLRVPRSHVAFAKAKASVETIILGILLIHCIDCPFQC